MKKYTYTGDEWHIRLCKLIYEYYEPTDICSHVRKIIGSTMILCISVIGIFLGTLAVTIPIGELIYGLITTVINGEFYGNIQVIQAGFALYASVLIYVVWAARRHIRKWWWEKLNTDSSYEDYINYFDEKSEPGFIKTYYQSLKEKTCVLMEKSTDTNKDKDEDQQ